MTGFFVFKMVPTATLLWPQIIVMNTLLSYKWTKLCENVVISYTVIHTVTVVDFVVLYEWYVRLWFVLWWRWMTTHTEVVTVVFLCHQFPVKISSDLISLHDTFGLSLVWRTFWSGGPPGWRFRRESQRSRRCFVIFWSNSGLFITHFTCNSV